MGCKNGRCGLKQGSNTPQVATPVSQGFDQAQLYGNQYGAMSGATQLPKKSFWKGSKEALLNFPTQTPMQNQVANQSLGQAMQLLQGGTDYSGWDPIESQYKKYYNQDLIPSLAERFTAMPGYGSQNSSAFANALQSGASDFAQGLAAQKSQYGMQQQGLQNQRLSTLLSGGMAPQFQQSYIPAQPGFLQGLGNSIAGGFGAAGSLGLRSLFGL